MEINSTTNQCGIFLGVRSKWKFSKNWFEFWSWQKKIQDCDVSFSRNGLSSLIVQTNVKEGLKCLALTLICISSSMYEENLPEIFRKITVLLNFLKWSNSLWTSNGFDPKTTLQAFTFLRFQRKKLCIFGYESYQFFFYKVLFIFLAKSLHSIWQQLCFEIAVILVYGLWSWYFIEQCGAEVDCWFHTCDHVSWGVIVWEVTGVMTMSMHRLSLTVALWLWKGP